jgi:hypothetical protein
MNYKNKYILIAIIVITFSLIFAYITTEEVTPSSLIKAHIQDMLTKQTDIIPLSDIPDGVNNATLIDASYFAWQEFIALNWPAIIQTGQYGDREKADMNRFFGEPASSSASSYPALVWETFRHKVEIYPGQGKPHGYKNTPLPNQSTDFGYDLLPQYIYDDKKAVITNLVLGEKTPWVNLDEASQIGTNQMLAGLNPEQLKPEGPGRLILFLAKANRKQYQYVASRRWWDKGEVPMDTPINPTNISKTVYPSGSAGSAISQTKDYITQNKKSPPPGALNGTSPEQKEHVSFANGTIEIKTAWRLATELEKLAYYQEGYIAGYHAGMVRYYSQVASSTTTPAIFEAKDTLGVMLGLHIIHKTPSAPHFIFATFEHKDNIRRPGGIPLEDANGNIVGPIPTDATTSNVTSIPSYPVITNGVSQPFLAPQTFTPNETTPSTYTQNEQSYYINNYDSGLASDQSSQPKIGVNRRRYAIPQDVIDVNKDVHQMIATSNDEASNPWTNYRLTNVQWKPMTKKPGTEFLGANKAEQATYYQSNSVIETNHILSEFSGRFYTGNTITDFDQKNKTQPFHNVYSDNNGYLMGGCMGCHGNQQVSGSDFSFIFASPVASPENAGLTYPKLVSKTP